MLLNRKFGSKCDPLLMNPCCCNIAFHIKVKLIAFRYNAFDSLPWSYHLMLTVVDQQKDEFSLA